MRRAALALVCVLATITATGCQQGIGRVDPRVVSLYDDALVDGSMEIEIDRDGSVRKVEAEIAVDELPRNALDAARAARPGAIVVGAERDLFRDGTEAFEVQLRDGDVTIEVVVDAFGNVVETETTISRDEAPLSVLRGAEAALPGGAFQSIERVERRGDVTYHVKKNLNGASYKLVLDASGTVRRIVREARAEIEIPIAELK